MNEITEMAAEVLVIIAMAAVAVIVLHVTGVAVWSTEGYAPVQSEGGI